MLSHAAALAATLALISSTPPGVWHVESMPGPPDAVAFQCSGHAMSPVGEGVIIRANAFSSCTGGPDWRPQRIVIEIQRGRWYGFQTVAAEDSGYTQEGFLERTDLQMSRYWRLPVPDPCHRLRSRRRLQLATCHIGRIDPIHLLTTITPTLALPASR